MTGRQFQGALRQADARGLVAELTGALAAGDVTLDLSRVDQIDAGVLQVLISASTLADRTGRRLHLAMPEGCAAQVMAQALALPALASAMPGIALAQAAVPMDDNSGQDL